MKIVKKGEVSWKWVVELENGQWGSGMSAGSQEDVQLFKDGWQYVATCPNAWWKSKKVKHGRYNSKMGSKCQNRVWTFKNVIGGSRKVESGCEHVKTHQKESVRGGWSCFDSVMGGEGPVLLLRYDISELWEMGGGVEMQAAEATERNRSVSLCRVKTWPQLMCCALV